MISKQVNMVTIHAEESCSPIDEKINWYCIVGNVDVVINVIEER